MTVIILGIISGEHGAAVCGGGGGGSEAAGAWEIGAVERADSVLTT